MNKQPKTVLRTLSLIHGALLIGLALFTAIMYWQSGGFVANMDQTDFFIYLVPIFAASGYFIGKLLFQKNLATVEREHSLESKLGKYQTAAIIQYALVEGPAFLALVAYGQSGNALYLAIAGSLILYLFALRPTPQRIANALQLSPQEKNLIS